MDAAQQHTLEAQWEGVGEGARCARGVSGRKPDFQRLAKRPPEQGGAIAPLAQGTP